jgi:lysyl-tRNA synthetase class 2
VETPALQVSPGLEPHLMAFATEQVAPDERRSRLYLHTSPEFAMKKLLAAGEERIFQIARVFRNGERSDTHHPEFAMLEWYRAGADYQALMEDCEGLLRAAAEAVGAKSLRWKGRAADPLLRAERISVAEAFSRHAGIDILATAPVADAPDAALLSAEARRIGVRVAPGDEWEDIFFRVFLERIEPKLGHPAATILHDYPISMAALSRPKPDDPRLAERFELYVAGLELANAFSELTDANEQRRRFAAWGQAKEARHGFSYPVDEDFLAALPAMPAECAGIALGIDRLAMLIAGAGRIEDVLWAPVAEGGV